MDLSWADIFINAAQLYSLKSKDPSTKVGCVMVGPAHEPLMAGFNGFPIGIEDDIKIVPERYERPAKYQYTVHAEKNCIDLSARRGVSLHGATAYLNWTPIPCPGCAGSLIQAGIRRIVGPDRPFAGKGDWSAINAIALPMLQEAGIELITIPDFKFIVPLE